MLNKLIQAAHLLLVSSIFIPLIAQEQPQRNKKYQGKNPPIKPVKHSNGNIELSGILLNRTKKEISFEAEFIVGAEPNKEYLITTNPDLSHEALFFTKIQPFHLQFMLYALGADTKTIRTPKGRRGSIIDIEVEYKNKGRVIRKNIESWLKEDGQPSRRRGFYFLGSRIYDNFFQAQANGKICSLWHQDDAILDIIHPENDRGDIFSLNHNNLGLHKFSKVKIVLSLRKE